MQIVIDVPNWLYNAMLEHKEPIYSQSLAEAVRDGTPLPKGHGRLIDEKEINNVVNGVFCACDRYSPKTFLNVIHSQCIEVIGADMAESEE